jgi:PAS domain S-box-containing protein
MRHKDDSVTTNQKPLNQTDTDTILRSVLDCSDNIVIYCLDTEMRYVYFNHCHRTRVQQLWGYDLQPGMHVAEVSEHPQERKRMLALFHRALGGESVQSTVEYAVKSQSPVFKKTIYNPIARDDGTVIGIVAFVMDVTEQKMAEQQLRRQTRNLDKRVRELNGIYAISKAMEKQGVSIQSVLELTMKYLPGCWQYPDIAAARIQFREETFQSVNWTETQWTQKSAIIIDEEPLGELTIGYLQERPQMDEGPFLKEERDLIDAITSRLVKFFKRKQIEAELETYKSYLEELVHQRTSELNKKEEVLVSQAKHLAEVNTALKILLEQRERDKKDLKENILQNVEELIFPYIQKLKSNKLTPGQGAMLDIIESNLNHIVSPFLNRLNKKYRSLTPTEVQIANFVKQGKTNDEIAQLLCVSLHTVTAHRYHIRTKLGLKNRKVNLRVHLKSLDEANS